MNSAPETAAAIPPPPVKIGFATAAASPEPKRWSVRCRCGVQAAGVFATPDAALQAAVRTSGFKPVGDGKGVLCRKCSRKG